MERIGILGGTFNPPHIGHVETVKAAREELGLSKVLVIPAGLPPHKRLPEGSASAGERLAMTRLAMRGLPYAEVSDMEVTREGASYTADTLAVLASLHPESELYLICGSDMFLTVEQWRRFEAIAALCTIVAAARSAEDRARLLAHREHLESSRGARARVLQNEVTEISSTELRSGLSEGRLTRYLPSGVLDYIERQSLYGVKPRKAERDIREKE